MKTTADTITTVSREGICEHSVHYIWGIYCTNPPWIYYLQSFIADTTVTWVQWWVNETKYRLSTILCVLWYGKSGWILNASPPHTALFLPVHNVTSWDSLHILEIFKAHTALCHRPHHFRLELRSTYGTEVSLFFSSCYPFLSLFCTAFSFPPNSYPPLAPLH